MLQDVPEDRGILRHHVFTGQKRENQDRLLPLGMKAQLGPQVFPILFEDMECGDVMNILRKIRYGCAPFQKEVSGVFGSISTLYKSHALVNLFT